MKLIEIHHHIYKTIDEYYKFSCPNLFRIFIPSIFFKYLKIMLSVKNDPNTDFRLQRILVLGNYKEEDKENYKYQILTSQYPIEALASLIKEKFPDASFESLLAINNINDFLEKRMVSPMNFIGFLSGIISMVIFFIPSSYLTPDVKELSLSALLLVLAYGVYLLGTTANYNRKERELRERVRDVLVYCIEAYK